MKISGVLNSWANYLGFDDVVLQTSSNQLEWIGDNTWHFVTVTSDGSNWEIYVH